ncbi:MAG: sigma-54-dependent Fis family transcriptional regulator, partial [Verrucomicrobiae bacterium]|nr:sigma-54-dependent Fis family transcriptional regulator [Verrucomicrobiae bacterium]
FDVLRKESLSFELRPSVEKALQAAEQTRIATEAAMEKSPRETSSDLIIGRSPAMQDVFKLIGRVARADAPVLITGESGVGKEVVANAVHKFSRRASAEYVAINCAAIPGNLLESELFGHEKGAFTGAVSQRVGRFEQCDGGTLFLDEIGDMPLEIQSKLLRVLQSGEFSRVGGNQTLTSNVRILAATNKHLEAEVEGGRFREDLFYRLNVVRIHIPPLRQRREDIRLLAEHFLSRQGEGSGIGRRMQFSPEAIDQLEHHDWPGNVRELENTIQRACVLATGNVLLPRDLPLGRVPRIGDRDGGLSGGSKSGQGSNGSVSLESAAQAFLQASKSDPTLGPALVAEREIIRAVLASTDDETAAAKQLGMTKAMLKKRRDQFQL